MAIRWFDIFTGCDETGSAIARHARGRVRVADEQGVSEASITAAKQAQAAERRAFTQATGVPLDDDGRLGLRLANAIASAAYGVRGEKRG